MAQFNADFWEIPAEAAYIESVPAEKALWFETDVDRSRRHALNDFFASVLPAVHELIDEELTGRQKEVLKLYFFHGKTQEDIAEMLDLTQSTVSRHLFGTVRNGRKVGGAIPKLRKMIESKPNPRIDTALDHLQRQFAQTATDRAVLA